MGTTREAELAEDQDLLHRLVLCPTVSLLKGKRLCMHFLLQNPSNRNETYTHLLVCRILRIYVGKPSEDVYSCILIHAL